MKTYTKAEVARQPQALEWVNASEARALARKLARIELLWDRCEGVPYRADMVELHQLIIDTEPHVDDELDKLRRQAEAAKAEEGE